jgi:mannitol PTS system EIICBA or EIICB component
MLNMKIETNVKSGAKTSSEAVQKFGRFLSGMVLPNIGAFIAWGLITALFIPTGWTPNEKLSALVGPMITYLLPILIGYTGGKMVAGTRGGVLGAIATMGVVVGAGIPMFIGAMIMGPLGGLVIKKFDEAVEGKVAKGFEMLVNNFSAGIIGMLLALLAYVAIGPVVLALNNVLKAGVDVFVNAGLLPLASLFIEPAKILFLNNAINHGVLGPLGVQQVAESGKSIFFLLESNPGPGLGILLAYWVFAKGMIKQSAPGSIIIHFLGGIHEIYFPYVLMNPILVLAVIAGGASGVFTFGIFGAGLYATPSPGSIFMLLAMAAKGSHLGVIAGVVVSTVVSFLVASYFVKRSSGKETDEDLVAAKEKVAELKGTVVKKHISKIVFACDAGMGSSAMGASILKNKVKKAGLDIVVVNAAIEEIPADADVVVTHENLTARAKSARPSAEHISIKDFLDETQYDSLIDSIGKSKVNKQLVVNEEEVNIILKKENVLVNQKSVDYETAIKQAGELLYRNGYVEYEYIEAMLERERQLTSYIGKGVAIPHGVGKAKERIKKSGMVVLQYPEGVDFNGETAYMIIGIAGVGNEHISILSNIATAIEEDADAEKLVASTDAQWIHSIFTSM